MSIRINDFEVETYDDEDVSMVYQVSDIGDLANVKSTFSKTIKLPRSPHNQQIFRQLGIASDTSSMPYTRLRGSYDKGGVSILNNGIANIKSTNRRDYELFLQDGIVELFNLIKGLFFGQQINIDELIHEKTVQAVIDSYDGEYYRYLLHDYGGRTTINLGATTLVDIDFQVPSVNLKYLWDKIFEYVGYVYHFNDLNILHEISESWISYPKTNGERIDTPIVDFEIDSDRAQGFNAYFRNDDYSLAFWPNVPSTPPTPAPFFADFHEFGKISQVLVNGRLSEIRIDKAGTYRFQMNFDVIIKYKFKLNATIPVYIEEEHIATVEVFKNDYKVLTFNSNGDDKELAMILEQGDRVRFVVKKYDEFANLQGATLTGMDITNWGGIEVKVIESNILEYDYLDAFRNLTPETLIKEVMQRFALTPIIDSESKTVTFYTIDEILKSNSIDWTDEYVERENEVYSMPKYAINNIFKMRYSDDNVGYADAVIVVGNENLPLERTVLESKFYAPLEESNDVSFGVNVDFSFRQTPIWTTEINQKDDGEIEVKYKPEKDRFYWLRSKSVEDNIFLTSLNLADTSMTDKFNIAETLDTEMPFFINSFHQGHKVLMENFRMHNIRLILTETDIATLDFTRLYCFAQEQQYYKLNRIVTNKDGTCTGEFIRVLIEKIK